MSKLHIVKSEKLENYNSKTVLGTIQHNMQHAFDGIGLARGQVLIGAPLKDVSRPTAQKTLSSNDIGLSIGTELDIIPFPVVEDLLEGLMPDDLQEQFQKGLEQAIAADEALQASMRNGVTGAEEVTVLGLLVAIAPVVIAGAALYQVYNTMKSNEDDDGDGVRNGLDKWPRDPDRNVVAREPTEEELLRQDREPWPIFGKNGRRLLMYSLAATNTGPDALSDLKVQMSFDASADALAITCAAFGQQGEISLQLTLKDVF